MILYYFSGIWFFFISLSFLLLSLMFMLMNLSMFMEWNLLNLNSVVINMYIYLDWISLMFMFLVLFISSMIMFYSVEYMSHDNYKNRFFFLVFLFIVSMMLMILSPSMVSIILGWDGLGLVSYCLVIFYNNYSSANSGMLTVLMNRVGDIMIMFSIMMMFSYGSWNFMNLNNLSVLLLILLMIASFTKSAQLPFSSWLPAAMAAPTPVSSLVHSSTLVTAGIYLLIRFNYLMYKNESLLMWILTTGMLTMFMAGLSAIFEYDLKKIIAYSTLSQLGLMMVIYGMKNFMLCYFHLLIHAIFKSMMFMCSGAVIHNMNVQDIRFMGNLSEFMPMTLMMMLISNFSLCGLPFMSGFYSKDMILEKIFMSKFNLILYLILLVSTMLTVIYSFRLFYYLIEKNFMYFSLFKISDFKIMNYSMFLLMLNSMIMGFILNWMIFYYIEEVFMNFFEKILILLICMMSFFLMKYLYKFKFKNNSFYKFFFGKMWMLYHMNMFITFNLVKFMNKYTFMLDKGWNEEMILNYTKNFMKLMKFNVNMNYLNVLFLLISYYLVFMIILN